MRRGSGDKTDWTLESRQRGGARAVVAMDARGV